MSDCKDKKCKDCNEDYLQGMLPCVTLPELCADGETCEETYNAKCVRYTGAAVVCGSTTVLSTGMTTQEALISLANAICLSGGGGLVDLTELEECCATNTTNITNLQTNLTIVNTTLTTISTQITTINTTLGTINTQITALQECCDASLKKCPNGDFPVAYALVGCTPNDDVAGQDLFYIDRQHAGLTENQITPANISPNWSGTLALNPLETAAAFYVRAYTDTFGVSWTHNPTAPLVPDPSAIYYPVIQAGSFQIPYKNHYSTILNADAYIGLSGIAGYALLNDLHISASDPGAPIEAIGIQGIASTSDIENIGGEFISKWRGATSGKNTAIRGRANGSDLNSGYDIEVGLTTDANKTNVGGKIIVKSGAGSTNHGLKIDVSQALGVTYAIQLKDTTAAAGKFLKAVDSDGNAIWDTVNAGGTVPPGVVSNNNINGTINYVTKWTAADQIGDSQIIDNGSNLSIGASPLSNSLLYIRNASKTYGIQLSTEKNAGFGAALIATGVGGVGAYISAQGAGGANIGASISSTNGLSNYAVQLIDTTSNVAGRYLRNMTTDGKANWANINITEVTNGLSSTLLGAPNGIATLDNNSKLVMSQMPISVMDYKGTFNPTVPSPPLQDGVGNTGDVYAVTAAGTYTFGAGNTLTLGVGDWVIYNGTIWEKTLGNNVGAGTVTSVGLTVGTTGTDVNISNSPITTSGAIALNIPTASSTARGLLSTTDWTTFNNKIGGAGVNNFVAKYTTLDGKTIGISRIFDDGTSVSMGTGASAVSNTAFYVQGASGHTFGGKFLNDPNGTSLGYGLVGSSVQTAGINVGVEGRCQAGGTAENIGIKSIANNGASNYAIQLQDSTEGTGKFLKSVTTDGKANWANITAADVSGAVGAVNGTLNYVAKFTPNGTTIGNSLIQDDDTKIGINSTPVNGNKIYIVSDQTAGINLLSNISNINTGIGITTTVQGTNNVGNTGITSNAYNGNFTTTGVQGSASSTSGVNKGIEGISSGTSTNIGLRGYAVGGSLNYSAQLQDGTEAAGKFLKSVTAQGHSNWAYLPDSAQLMCSDMTTPITASTALAKSFWIAPCNGQLTDIFANLYSPQAGGAIFTVSIKMNGATIASPSFTAGAQQSSIIPASNTFIKGTLFEVFVTQVGDGSAKGLLATINYLRT